MTERPEQLEALISRQGDDDLTVDERAQIRRLLADDPAAAEDARVYSRLSDILAGYRCLPADLDFHAFAGDLSARIAEQVAADASAELDRAIDPTAGEGVASPARDVMGPRFNKASQALEAVDDLVMDAVGPMPEVDFDAFKARVSAAVRKEAALQTVSPAEHRWPRVLGWFAPLAAAAAVAGLVWYPGSVVTPGAKDDGAALTFAFAVDVPAQDGRIVVSFEETNDGAAVQEETTQGGSAIAIAPAPVADNVDDAFLY